MRVEAIDPAEPLEPPPDEENREDRPAPAPLAEVALWSGGQSLPVPLFDRATFRTGQRIAGPALIRENSATTVLDPGWVAEVRPGGLLVLRRMQPRAAALPAAPGEERDPAGLALFNSVFAAAAEQMGNALRNTARSVNIRERLDFSCAIFDARGALVANAPHVPVHLGAMGESVRHVIAQRGNTLRPGDAVALNDPFNGGTHLPDITVVTPVFDARGERIRFFVGSRGHHADIGGITPGSVPPFSTRLEEEGVVLDDVLVLRDGVLLEAELRGRLRDAPFPARDPDTNVADLVAQLAANRSGAAELGRVAARVGWDALELWAGRVIDNGELAVRQLLRGLPGGRYSTALDDGTPLVVAVTVDAGRGEAEIDFAGTGPQRPGNLNAPPAVVRAAVLFVLRCLLRDEIPLNDGCLRPVTLRVPHRSFLSPEPGAAVVSGNTEVSQAVANALFAAVGACAASQGTMNNLTFGDDAVQYYETIAGGTGAGAAFDGAHGVHSHMTNTRMTDPEIMEMRFPVRVEEFSLRPGSGGPGRHKGGDGLLRRLRFLRPMTAMLVSSRRTSAPFGLAGGGDGAPGAQWIEHADGTTTPLPGVFRAELGANDVLAIATPGGGGFGNASSAGA
jgi:5-oxoprolinase (ATP-hydrolysing)